MPTQLFQARSRRPLAVIATIVIATWASSPRLIAAPAEVGPVPAGLRERLNLDPFYQKHLDAGGLPVLGSAKVSDNAMAEAAWIIGRLLGGRPDILRAMAAQDVRAVVMAGDEYTTDVPEHAFLRPKLYWDRRARGLGATPATPVVSAGEENLLGFRRDPYPHENIFIHEFAHAIHEVGLNKVDPTFDGRLSAAFQSARGRGLWKDTYAATNRQEYWSEGVQSWFDDNAPPDALHNDVRTRARLREYDPGLAALCREVLGDGAWRYRRPRDRDPEGRAHLSNYDPRNLPQFHWRVTEPGEHPRVLVQTTKGDFEIELDEKATPAAVKNFLSIALDAGYHSGQFVKETGGNIRATVNPDWRRDSAKELALNHASTLATTSTRSAECTVAMFCDGSDRFGFVIFLEEADVRPAEFLPIGRVTTGREVVRLVRDSLGRDGDPPHTVEIRRVIRNER